MGKSAAASNWAKRLTGGGIDSTGKEDLTFLVRCLLTTVTSTSVAVGVCSAARTISGSIVTICYSSTKTGLDSAGTVPDSTFFTGTFLTLIFLGMTAGAIVSDILLF